MELSELKLIGKYTFKYKRIVFFVTVLAIICTFFETINIGLLVPLLQLINSTGTPTGNLWDILEQLFSLLQIELNFVNLLIFLVILFIFGQILLFYKKKLQVMIRFRFIADIKNNIFSNVLRADILYHASQKGGQYINILNAESESAGTSIFQLTELLTNTLLILAYVVMLVYISPELTAICFVIGLISFILLNLILAKSKTIAVEVVEVNTRMNEFTSERFHLLKLIKIFSTENNEIQSFFKITDAYAKQGRIFQTNGILIESVFQVIMFTLAVVILIMASMVLNLSLPMILVYIFILIRLSDPLRQINQKRHELEGNLASLKKIDQILTESQESTTIKSGEIIFPGIKEEIILDQVSFSYQEGMKTLHAISLKIRKNEMVALVGASGGGKSTLINVIIRLIEPNEGSIKIDSVDISRFDLASYRRKIGFVSQDSYLINESILMNIAYGCDRISRDRAMEVAKMVNAHEFITQLPRGYDTEIGDNGVKLSGGQKQRLSLARALYREPELLILDEATSALDSESERVIQESISLLKHRYTIVAIAHRLSTIRNSDKIVVIEKGSITESGSHNDLLKLNGNYAKYYALQHENSTEDSP
ncbi:ABC transporter ATP-binding protein [Methanoregula sp.]|uniref:ABC transporter ATP-binding protein n=1 Tax=Methanoregula sp. TaxID=2052170 RepID=UPI003568E43D